MAIKDLTPNVPRHLELKACVPARRGHKDPAAAYSIMSAQDWEKRWVEQAYRRFVSVWQPKGPKERTGATMERAS